MKICSRPNTGTVSHIQFKLAHVMSTYKVHHVA